MYIGESRYFDIVPVGISGLVGYVAFSTLTKKNNGVIHQNQTVNKSADLSKFEVRIQTAGLSVGTYRLVVFVNDTVSGNITAVHDEEFDLVSP